jgi:hypothetical protein
MRIFFVQMRSYGVMILHYTSRVFGGRDNESNNSEEPDPMRYCGGGRPKPGNEHTMNKTTCSDSNASYALLVLLVLSI